MKRLTSPVSALITERCAMAAGGVCALSDWVSVVLPVWLMNDKNSTQRNHLSAFLSHLKLLPALRCSLPVVAQDYGFRTCLGTRQQNDSAALFISTLPSQRCCNNADPQQCCWLNFKICRICGRTMSSLFRPTAHMKVWLALNTTSRQSSTQAHH